MHAHVSLHPVIVQQRVIDIEQEYSVRDLGHGTGVFIWKASVLHSSSRGISPWPVAADQLSRFVRTPGSGTGCKKGRHVVEDRPHNTPLSINDTLTSEQIAATMRRDLKLTNNTTNERDPAATP